VWRPGRSPQELLDALRSAGEETERLVQLSEDLLVVARADVGGLPVRQGPIDLGQALSELSWRFTPRFAAADRDLSVEVEEGNGVSADRMRLEQAIGNLLENALRHGAGRVRLWTAHDGQWIRIHVSDEGTGFPADFLPLAFERFARADPGRSQGGTGLGLAIVDAIARAHGGSAHAGHRAGGGADVWLVLPLDRGRLEPLAV
jgi:signal transduction histidine kinase